MLDLGDRLGRGLEIKCWTTAGSKEREPGHRKKQHNGLHWPRTQIRLRCSKSLKCFKAMKVEVAVVENALNIVDHRSDGGWTCLDSFLNFYVSHRPFFS